MSARSSYAGITPDDVADQLCHLRRRERDARSQLIALGEGLSGVHKRLALGQIVVEALEVAVAGELGDLLAHEALLVGAVAQALGDPVGVVAQGVQEVVQEGEPVIFEATTDLLCPD